MAKYFNLAALLASAALAAALPAQAQKIGQAPLGEPAVPQTHSIEQADARLAEVAQARAAVQAEYDAAEQVCNAKFFVNYCLDAVKEKRRVALAGLRAIEVEANQYKRKAAVDKRDAELAERMKKDEEELARRQENPPPPAEREAAKPAAKPGASLEQRQAGHDAKLKAQAAKDAAEAPKRAASVAAFEKKKAESEKRQAEVAAKKAAKEEKIRKREAEAAAKAAKDAADAAARAAKK